MVTVGLLLTWPMTAFWILVKPLIWEVCSANQWDAWRTAMPAAGTGQQKGSTSSPQQGPIPRDTTNASEVEQIGLRSSASSVVFTSSLDTWLPLLQASQQLRAGKNTCSRTRRKQKMLSNVHQILKHRFLCYRNKQTCLIGKNVLTVIVPILINKDGFEPSYYNLKVTV